LKTCRYSLLLLSDEEYAAFGFMQAKFNRFIYAMYLDSHPLGANAVNTLKYCRARLSACARSVLLDQCMDLSDANLAQT
jgi:hypothetical protein